MLFLVVEDKSSTSVNVVTNPHRQIAKPSILVSLVGEPHQKGWAPLMYVFYSW